MFACAVRLVRRFIGKLAFSLTSIAERISFIMSFFAVVARISRDLLSDHVRRGYLWRFFLLKCESEYVNEQFNQPRAWCVRLCITKYYTYEVIYYTYFVQGGVIKVFLEQIENFIWMADNQLNCPNLFIFASPNRTDDKVNFQHIRFSNLLQTEEFASSTRRTHCKKQGLHFGVHSL